MDDANVKEDAIALITEVTKALASGTKHYRKSDNALLTTVKEIIIALTDEGEIIFESSVKQK